MPICFTESLDQILAQLPGNKNVWKYMLNVTQIPRGSNGKGENFRHLKIQKYLKETAESLGHEVIVEPCGNLVIRKKATPGFESKPTVCLQCHMDMVCQKDDNVTIDMGTDPLVPRIVGENLMATGTSLGADDGAGIATIFAILEDDSFNHGPIEVLVTRDEETGLNGANAHEVGLLKSQYFINCDSEEQDAICIGCSGGTSLEMELGTVRENRDGFVKKCLTLNNFIGGHSGCDIQLGRANPMKVMSRLLKSCNFDDYRLVSFDCGTARNAIPRKCVADVAIVSDKVDSFISTIQKTFASFTHEYKKIETEATLDIADSTSELIPLDLSSTKRFVHFTNVFPFGPQRWSPDVAGLVETSVTCAMCKTHTPDCMTFTCSIRSSAQSQIDEVWNRIESICDLTQTHITQKMAVYPGWEPNVDNLLNKYLEESYVEVTHKQPKVYAIHAGLECGIITSKYPNMICSSIGPEVKHPHSPQEKLLISSVQPLYEVLVKTLEKLAK
ncbi:hypothetical protein WA158_006635 [Blastocystis sp. Blastoise]